MKQHLEMYLLLLPELRVFVSIAVIIVTTLVLVCYLLCRRHEGEYTVEVWLESASSDQKQSWHKGEKLRRAVSSFHERFARVPRRLDEARERHTRLIENLLSHLRGKGIPVHPEYVGSAYEGVKVAKSEGNDDLEFDVLVTMKLPRGWNVYTKDVPNIAGHMFLYVSGYFLGQNKTFFESILTRESGYSLEGPEFFIDGKKTIDKFFGELQNWINLSWETKQKILLRRHGPAVQMDVYEQTINSDPPYYTVDVVPALEIEVSAEKMLYVAKPVKSRIMPDLAAWRPLSPTETKFSGPYNDERVDRFTPTHLKYMLEIEEHLRYRLRFAGHKIGTSDNNLEFKVLVIDDSRKNQIEVSHIVDKPDYFRLNLKIGLTKERLNSRKETTSFVSALQQVISSSRLLNGKVHIRREGSTVRLIVCEIEEQAYVVESFTKPPVYYVDMILAFEVGGRLYVARPNEDWYTNEMENSKAWRLSHSVQAKADLYGQNGCMKMVLRILKVLRNQEVALTPLTSYHLKTVILRLIHKNDFNSDWSEKCLGERLMDALLELEKCLKNKNLPHHYLKPEVNLTSHMVEGCINDMGCRIHVLCTKEQEMMRVLHASN